MKIETSVAELKIVANFRGVICAFPLEEIGLEAIDCVAQYAGESMFEVTSPDNRQFVVDLRRRRCGCKKWEITGIPCPHTVATILYDCGDP